MRVANWLWNHKVITTGILIVLFVAFFVGPSRLLGLLPGRTADAAVDTTATAGHDGSDDGQLHTLQVPGGIVSGDGGEDCVVLSRAHVEGTAAGKVGGEKALLCNAKGMTLTEGEGGLKNVPSDIDGKPFAAAAIDTWFTSAVLARANKPLDLGDGWTAYCRQVYTKATTNNGTPYCTKSADAVATK